MRLKITERPFNSGGKGGQHSNRSMNAIEASVTLPNGTVLRATSQTLKSQLANRKIAKAQLALKVRHYFERQVGRSETAGFGPEGRVRTYHEPDNRVVDEAGPRFTYSQTAGRGDLGEVIEARRLAILEAP